MGLFACTSFSLKARARRVELAEGTSGRGECSSQDVLLTLIVFFMLEGQEAKMKLLHGWQGGLAA